MRKYSLQNINYSTRNKPLQSNFLETVHLSALDGNNQKTLFVKLAEQLLQVRRHDF